MCILQYNAVNSGYLCVVFRIQFPHALAEVYRDYMLNFSLSTIWHISNKDSVKVYLLSPVTSLPSSSASFPVSISISSASVSPSISVSFVPALFLSAIRHCGLSVVFTCLKMCCRWFASYICIYLCVSHVVKWLCSWCTLIRPYRCVLQLTDPTSSWLLSYLNVYMETLNLQNVLSEQYTPTIYCIHKLGIRTIPNILCRW